MTNKAVDLWILGVHVTKTRDVDGLGITHCGLAVLPQDKETNKPVRDCRICSGVLANSDSEV